MSLTKWHCGVHNHNMKEPTQKGIKLETATFGGGCFWCTEAIFKRLKGVMHVQVGYAGGKRGNPNYEQVSTGVSGHAESVQLMFDPAIIPYEKLLEIFWHTHNPTTLNQQGADVGTEYRSVIFYHTQEQKQLAEKSRQEIEASGMYKNPIVTEIVPFTNFYPAEQYHQDFYDKNRYAPYCMFVIDPKIQKLLKEFGNEVKEEYK